MIEVLKQTSPTATPSAPAPLPRKTGPSSRTKTALGGAGDTRLPTLGLMACALGVLFPASWLLARAIEPGLVGAWLGAFAYMIAYAALMQWRFHAGRWATILPAGGEA